MPFAASATVRDALGLPQPRTSAESLVDAATLLPTRADLFLRLDELAADVLLPDPDAVLVRRLGIDEHRYRSVRFFREPDGGWRRYEPWMTTLVDADTGRVLGVVDGRDSAGVGAWLAARSQAWRDAVEVVAIDPSAAFRKALREQLPAAAVSVDTFHLVKLANDTKKWLPLELTLRSVPPTQRIWTLYTPLRGNAKK